MDISFFTYSAQIITIKSIEIKEKVILSLSGIIAIASIGNKISEGYEGQYNSYPGTPTPAYTLSVGNLSLGFTASS